MENQPLIANAVKYAKEHAANSDITIEDVAACAGFSIDYFNKLFLAHTGFTVMAYINYTRCKKAVTALRNTDRSILDIALDVGYNSHEGFIKAFKKQYGMTPNEYRNSMKNKVLSYGELTDKSVAARFFHANLDFQPIDRDTAIDFLLNKNAKQYGYFCTTIKCMGLEIAALNGDMAKGLIGIGDDFHGGSFLEIMTDDFDLLADWLKRFPDAHTFYSVHDIEKVKELFTARDMKLNLSVTPQAFYFGEGLPVQLPDEILIRPLTYDDKEQILKWANGRQDGYIKHLLNEKDYTDDCVLEYGIFKNRDLIAIAGCGIDEVHGFRLNNCCAIRFADGEASDELYRLIYTFVVNDCLDKGLLPFDDLQFGDYAASHGGFTAIDMGFTIVNQRYDIH